MRSLRYLTLACVLPFVSPMPVDAHPSMDACRQYYSGWQKNPNANYYYRYYYFKPAANYAGYRHHYVIYYPQRPKYCYFYNPYNHVYWGRCPTNTGGVGLYSLLAEADRRANLSEIPDSAFPAPAALPPIPEASDDAKLDLPPDDLPTNESIPAAS